MKIALFCIGRTEYGPYREAIERYVKRLVHYVPFEMKEIPDIKNTKNITHEQQCQAEGKLLLNAFNSTDYVMLLDERGIQYTSRGFSEFLSEKMVNLPGRLIFVIGGPYGFSDEVYARANAKISMSKMTFPHDLVRVIFVEQIYRAYTIMRNEPYHHD